MTTERNTTTRAKFSETDAAAIMGCNVKSMRARLVELGYTKPCGRCGGSGRYSYNPMDGDRCFGCSGIGKVLLPIVKTRVNEAKARQDAGELDAYFARGVAIRAAKAAFAPLMTEVVALYQPIADRYSSASRGPGGSEEFVRTTLFFVQGMANSIRWGDAGMGRPAACVGAMGASEIDFAVKHGDVGAIVAVREMTERVEMLKALRALFDAAPPDAILQPHFKA